MLKIIEAHHLLVLRRKEYNHLTCIISNKVVRSGLSNMSMKQ